MGKACRCRCQDPAAVAILARISDKDRQVQASIEAQLRETRELPVDPNGWRVVAEYQVKHRGSDLSRDPIYMTMIADARAGKFSRLCLHKFDRLARRACDGDVFWHVLTRECGIEVLAALEPYDLDSRSGKPSKKAGEFMANVYLDDPAEAVLQGMRQKAQGTHEPPAGVDRWGRCRAILRAHDEGKERRSRHVYALNTLLWFAELHCGAHAEYQAHVDLTYYRSRQPCPDGSKIYLRCDQVDDQVGDLLAELEIPKVLHPGIRKAYREEVSAAEAPARSEVERLRHRLAELEMENRGYLRLAAQGKISDREFDEERSRVAAAIATVRRDLGKLMDGPAGHLSDLDLALACAANSPPSGSGATSLAAS